MDAEKLKSIFVKLKLFVAAAGGAIGAFLGGADALLRALAVLMALDYLSGVICAAHLKKLSSQIGFKGICKKALILIIVGVAHTLDVSLLSGSQALRGAVISFYMGNEALSIAENAAKTGLPVPERLKNALSALKDDAKGEG